MNTVTEMQVTEVAMQAPMLLTDSAANKVKALIEEEGNADLKLRVFVSSSVSMRSTRCLTNRSVLI